MTTYLKGSQGEAVAFALGDETFRERALAFAEVRATLLEELTRAETGHHTMRNHVQCTEASRLDAGWKHHPGYLTAWFSLRSFRVRLRFIGELTAFAPELRQRMETAMERTAGNQRLALNVAASYGGRQDIAAAARAVAAGITVVMDRCVWRDYMDFIA